MLRSLQRWQPRRSCFPKIEYNPVRLFTAVTKHTTTQPLTVVYKENVVSGSISFDEKQYKLIKLLEKLQILVEQESLNQPSPIVTPPITTTQTSNETTEAATRSTTTATSPSETPNMSEESPKQRLRGVYLHGEVGTGKTMLMDLFFAQLTIPQKRRVHFSEFMLEVHRRVHLHKQALLKQFGRDINLNLSSERDSIVIVARDIAKEAQVLCFDEFQVTDICDAMILTRLFNELWKQNVVLVATSNRPPSDLYLNGLNRQYFLPFIDRLQINCIVRDINIHTDYRQGGSTAENAYFVGNTAGNRQSLHSLFVADIQRRQGSVGEVTIPVMNNRHLTLTHANAQAGVCYVSFAELCETDKGASDYQSLSAHFHTVYMHSIPVLSVLMHNEARRLITLIDAMYNSNVRFVWVADALPAQLFEILTSEEVQRGSGGALGTDHAWNKNITTTGESSSSRHSVVPYATANSTNIDTSGTSGTSGTGNSTTTTTNDSTTNVESKRHLRGAEGVRLPLDSNMYFGTSLKINTTAKSASDTPADAAQDEMKVLEGELASVQELSFAFRRAASRLTEMSSVGYLSERWRGRGGV